MALMWSRPGGLSLRTTWVTPTTIWLGIATVVALALPGLFAVPYGIATGQLLYAVGGLLAVALGCGGGTVAIGHGLRLNVARIGIGLALGFVGAFAAIVVAVIVFVRRHRRPPYVGYPNYQMPGPPPPGWQ